MISASTLRVSEVQWETGRKREARRRLTRYANVEKTWAVYMPGGEEEAGRRGQAGIQAEGQEGRRSRPGHATCRGAEGEARRAGGAPFAGRVTSIPGTRRVARSCAVLTAYTTSARPTVSFSYVTNRLTTMKSMTQMWWTLVDIAIRVTRISETASGME
jgi:hypothetical protein